MVDPPWDLLLTTAFLLTGTAGIWTLVVCPAPGAETVLHLNHAAMSAAMIVMVWVVVSDVAVWAQVALFTTLALALLLALREAGDTTRRADLMGNLALDGAMIWMLAAMPLLMADVPPGGHDAHAGHDTAAAIGAAADVPGWAIIVNSLFVAVCTAATIWWLVRATTVRTHRLAAVGHGLMAAGMATMLALVPA